MTPIDGQPILTAAATRAAEAASGVSAQEMMEYAGAGIAEAVRRLAVGAEALILCGPGNNGGDGYVAARVLKQAGHPVRVAALADPRTEAAMEARRRWDGPVEPFPAATPDHDAPVLVDAVFGTGLSRPLEQAVMRAIGALAGAARLAIAVDLPSGVDADTGAELNHVPQFHLTLALGALKPAHVLMPAAEKCGVVRLIDIDLDTSSPDATIAPPSLHAPHSWDYKYSRGMAVVIGGAMPGAAALASEAAMRAGAGYGLLFADDTPGLPHAVVQRPWSKDALVKAIAGKDHVVLVIGPGLGRDKDAVAKLEAVIACDRPTVIDGDALHLLDDSHFAAFHERATKPGHDRRVVLTPHAGEFKALFGDWSGSKIEAARAAARRAGAIVAFKGPDTVVAHPDGRTNTAVEHDSWLSTAGTGDVLAGAIAGVWHATRDANVEAAVWLHTDAARRAGASFIADDLAHALTAARAAL